MSAQMNATLWPLRHLGSVMEPDLGDPREAAGVLNPAIACGPDGQLYLLPRRSPPTGLPGTGRTHSSTYTPRS
jgi:hypothetical protein